MGYTLELYALRLETLETIARGSVKPEEVERAIWDRGQGDIREGTFSDAAVDLLIDLIRTRGRRLVSLEHASWSGQEFRATIERIAGSSLLRRPLIGIETGDFPWIGWLTLSEAASVGVRQLDSFDLSGPDEQGWASDLWRALDYATRVQLDVVSIYT
ncbi:MAG TPA: hypothetical protein VMF11_06545 [Candidatus Baltobacteraceae bacterium]|nr:hypothetical protein [Candidatus Baltobacteraceae bacterium]